MRVLQVIDSLRIGGAEMLVVNLHAGFRARGIECEYYLLHAEHNQLEQRLAELGARIHAPLSASVYSPLHIMELSRHLRTFDYNLVQVHLFPAQLWAACGGWLADRALPLVTTEHSTYARRRKPWYRGIDRWMYGRYHRVASISPAATRGLTAWLPEVGGKITECPNGVNVDFFASAVTPGKQAFFSAAEHVSVILCVGSLEHVKGQDILLRAVSLIPDILLALVGDGPLCGELHALAAELGIESRVRFLGRRMDVAQLLKAADLYVQPSRWEGFGIAALEAMASGKAIVASDVPGLAQVVGDAGLLFPAGDAAQLARSISTALDNPDLRQRLAQRAQQRARMFSLDTTLDCYEKLYREVVERGKDRPGKSEAFSV